MAPNDPPRGDLQDRAHRTGGMLSGCTACTHAQLGYAAALAQSFQQHHPGESFSVLVVDAKSPNCESSGLNIVSLDDISLPAGAPRQWPMLDDAAELIQRVTPWLLRNTLEADRTSVYIDAHTDVLAPLRELPELTESTAFVSRPAHDADRDADACDAGLVAVGKESDSFLKAWTKAEALDFVSKVEESDGARNSLQKVARSFRPVLLTQPAYGIGYWNIDRHCLEWKADHYVVDGEPVRLFCFAGYDANQAHLLSTHLGLKPNILLSEHPLLLQLCDEYRARVLAAGFERTSAIPYRFDLLPSGLRIDRHMKESYRDALLRFWRDETLEPPSPFGPAGEAGFLDWLNEPVSADGESVTRYMTAIWRSRPDLERAFPDPLGSSAKGFWNWLVNFGRRELDLPPALMPRNALTLDEASKKAVNIAGYLRAELGMGEAGRLLVAAVEASRVPFNTFTYDQTSSRQGHEFNEQRVDGIFADINLVCINADQIASFAESIGPEFFDGRYTIGDWSWEVEDFPPWMHKGFGYVDEVWVESEYMRAAIGKVSPKPVYKFCLPIVAPRIDATISRVALGLPANFFFLFSFDFLSVLERKNPAGLIKSFQRAFRPNEGPQLVIKTINADQRPLEMEKLRYAARGRSDILLIDRYFSAAERNALTAHCDCYVSLHRSEGFGLTMAEAMALGKPTIATNYSGNLDFMTAENSYLCRATRVRVGPEREPYPADSFWGEPDLDHAARLLRQVYDNPEEARVRGARAARDMKETRSLTQAGASIRSRIEIIRRRRSGAPGQAMPSVDLLHDQLEALKDENRRLAAELAVLKSRP